MLKKVFDLCLVAVLSQWLLSCSLAEEPAYRRGVNMAGPEFGTLPGKLHTNYTFNNEASFKYFAEKGFSVVRVPVKWERLQPSLSGPLDEKYLGGLKQNVAWAKAHGTSVIIDLHNYGRYSTTINGKRQGCVIDVPYDGEVRVKTADLADVWVRLSKEFKDESAVYAYGLMNEPHGMGSADWKAISNAALKAIRDSGDRKLILVGGDYYSNAAGWEKKNGAESWVNDPGNNFMYEAHCYFDSDNSGAYKKTYDQELAKNKNLPQVGRERVKGFIEWCARHKVRGFLGEYGVPRDDPRWNEVLDNFLQALDEAGMGGTYWAAGIYWGDKYPLSVHPAKNDPVDRPQMQVLLKHLSPPATVAANTISSAPAIPTTPIETAAATGSVTPALPAAPVESGTPPGNAATGPARIPSAAPRPAAQVTIGVLALGALLAAAAILILVMILRRKQ